MSKATKLTWTVLRSALVTFAVIVTLEVGAYLILPAHQEVIIEDSLLHHKWNPGTSYTHTEWAQQNPQFPEPLVHHYNQQSWLERYEVSQEKGAGVFRIFYLGDSFTEGCVPMEQSVAEVVERELNRRGCSVQFEVINTGTSSYSPSIYYVLLKEVLLNFAPDLIVLNVDLSDDYDDWRYEASTQFDNEGLPISIGATAVTQRVSDLLSNPVEGIRHFLFRYSHIFRLLLLIRDARRDQRATPVMMPDKQALEMHKRGLYTRWAAARPHWDDMTQRRVEYTLRMVSAFIRLAKRHQIEVVVTGVPHSGQFMMNDNPSTQWSTELYATLEETVTTHGGRFLNSVATLTPRFNGAAREQFYYRDDIHLNPNGNREWANIHVNYLQHHPSVAGLCRPADL